MNQWCIVAAKTAKARLLFEWNLKYRAIGLFKIAIYNNKLYTQKKQIADSFRFNYAKKHILYFFRDYNIERKIYRDIKEQNNVLAQSHFLMRMF